MSHDLAAPRRTGRRRAEQGAPLAAVQSSLQDPRSSAELFVALEALRRLPEPADGYA